MIGRLVSFALKQRFMIVAASIALMIYGAIAFRNLPIDAYPDLSPPHVELITQWPGHSAEEIERLITIPVEIEMNGIPRSRIAALHFTLRPLVHRIISNTAPIRISYANRLSNGCRRHVSPRRDAQPLAALQPERTDLSLCGAESGPLSSGAEDARELAARAALQVHPGVADDSGFGGTDDAVSGAP